MPDALARAPDPSRVDPDDGFAAELTGLAPALRAYARRLTGGAVDAEDLLQETMLRCWAARGRFEPGSSMAAWTRTVMRNAFLSAVRRRRRQADLPDDALEQLSGVAESQSRAVDLRDADRALGELPPDQRAAVLLASEGVTVEEAAARLAIPEGTFKSRVARGRLRLRALTGDAAAPQPADPPREEPREARPDRPRRRRSWKGVVIG